MEEIDLPHIHIPMREVGVNSTHGERPRAGIYVWYYYLSHAAYLCLEPASLYSFYRLSLSTRIRHHPSSASAPWYIYIHYTWRELGLLYSRRAASSRWLACARSTTAILLPSMAEMPWRSAASASVNSCMRITHAITCDTSHTSECDTSHARSTCATSHASECYIMLVSVTSHLLQRFDLGAPMLTAL